jgi:hypothetical protein
MPKIAVTKGIRNAAVISALAMVNKGKRRNHQNDKTIARILSQ